jgi:hypothetical protein
MQLFLDLLLVKSGENADRTPIVPIARFWQSIEAERHKINLIFIMENALSILNTINEDIPNPKKMIV